MLPSFCLIQFLFIFSAAILFIFILRTMVLIPYKQLQLFKKDGMTLFFFPILGYFRNWSLGYQDNGDCFSRFKRAKQAHPNESLLLTHIGKDPLILLRDVELIQDFYKQHYCYEKAKLPGSLFGCGLTFSDDRVWSHHGKILPGSFNYEALESKVPLIQATTKEFFNKISAEECKKYRLMNKIQEITGEIAGRMFLGENLNKFSLEKQSMADLILDSFALVLSPLRLLFGDKLVPAHMKILKKVEKLREVCHKMIEERKAKEGGDDFLATLLATQTALDPDDMMSDEEIVDVFTTSFSGSMNPTGHLIGMALYMLTKHPEYLEKLKKEREIFYKNGVDLDNLNQMEELHCFLKETLRFYNPIPFSMGRIAVKDHKLGDFDILKGMRVRPDYLAMAFDPQHWVKPEKFNPERWKFRVDSYAFVPFLAGPRNCLGQDLAIIEAKVIVSEFLEKFEFSLKDGYQLKMVHRFLYEPEDEILFNLKLI